jgi:hypothetical protein
LLSSSSFIAATCDASAAGVPRPTRLIRGSVVTVQESSPDGVSSSQPHG